VARWDACSAPADSTASIRNLTRGEDRRANAAACNIVAAGTNDSVHIVMMGDGANRWRICPVCSPALDVARESGRLGISRGGSRLARSGWPPAIDKLAASKVPYNLAVSLQTAPNDELRSAASCAVKSKKSHRTTSLPPTGTSLASGRRLTFEYVLLAG